MPTAITFDRFGGPDVLTVTDVEAPHPGRGEVRVRSQAIGVNPLDNKIRRGELAEVFPASFPIIPGQDVAGVVDLVGPGVSDIAVGDAVFGSAPRGSYAEFAVLPAAVKKPDTLSWELAAALPTVGETAFRALKQLDVQPGHTLLILGAGGSVGTIAVQLAVARGVTVVATAGTRDLARLSDLGATAINYDDDLVTAVRGAAPDGVDRVLDAAGAGQLTAAIELAGSPDDVVTLADMSAAEHKVRFSGLSPDERAPEALPELAELLASGALSLPIWASYPLTEAATAHADIDNHRSHGKIILLP